MLPFGVITLQSKFGGMIANEAWKIKSCENHQLWLNVMFGFAADSMFVYGQRIVFPEVRVMAGDLFCIPLPSEIFMRLKMEGAP